MTAGPNRLFLRNARLLDPCRSVDFLGDMVISDGVIKQLGCSLMPAVTDQIIDLHGSWLIPALTDLHVALRDPGYEYKETLGALADAAVAGGYTRLVGSPDTLPVHDTPAVGESLRARAAADGRVDLYTLGAVTRLLQSEQLAELADLVRGGVVGFSDGGRPVERAEVLRRILEYARQFDLPVFVRPEDSSMADGAVMHEGLVSTTLGLKGVPSVAEELMVFRAIALARLTGGRVHLTQLSTAGAVELVRQAKSSNVNISCDVSPHHLWFTDDRVRGYSTSARVSPPLRELSDRQALIHGLNDGTIDAVASGHAAQSLLEKEVEFEAAQPGVASLETAAAAILTLASRGELDEFRALHALICQPAEIAGIQCQGLAAGGQADLAVVAFGTPWRVQADRLAGSCRSCVFDGIELNARVQLTLRRGKIVFAAGDLPAG